MGLGVSIFVRSNMKRTAVIVPSIREKSLQKFFDTWSLPFKSSSLKIIVVEDNPQRTFFINTNSADHYSWKEIDKELGRNSWIIPRRTDCIRSFGFYKAYKEGFEHFISVDDDCYSYDINKQFEYIGSASNPFTNFVSEHDMHLSVSLNRWLQTMKFLKARGIPYFNLGKVKPVVNMGFWNGVPDIDAPTQLVKDTRSPEFVSMYPVPSGFYFPMSGMNLAFTRQILPAMYFLLMGKDWPYDRFGDIWAGIIVKKICDHLRYSITIGQPSVYHSRASNIWQNLKKELPGLELNETFWEMIDKMKLTKNNVSDCYLEIVEQLPDKDKYFKKLKEAMKIWIKILE